MIIRTIRIYQLVVIIELLMEVSKICQPLHIHQNLKNHIKLNPKS